MERPRGGPADEADDADRTTPSGGGGTAGREGSGGWDAPAGRGADGSQGSQGSQVDDVLVALADPTRRRLLELLAARGEVTATVLAQDLPVSRQAIVKHLAVLESAGLASSHKVGREVRFAVRPAPLDRTARWMASLAADWDRRLARIKRIAEAAERDGEP